MVYVCAGSRAGATVPVGANRERATVGTCAQNEQLPESDGAVSC